MVVCEKCHGQMECTQTGRTLIFRSSSLYPGDKVYHGDQFTCRECNVTIVVCNTNPTVWPGAFAYLTGQAREQEWGGRKADFPIAMKEDKPSSSDTEPSRINRDVTKLDEKQLQEILWGSTSNEPAAVKLTDKFTEDEILRLIGHPGFDKFTPGFREQIWQVVCEIFGREIRRLGTN